MDQLKIQLLEYSLDFYVSTYNSRVKDELNGYQLVFKNDYNIFTANTIQYGDGDYLIFHDIDNNRSISISQLTNNNPSNFHIIRDKIVQAFSYRDIGDLHDKPHLLLVALSTLVSKQLEENVDSTKYPFLLTNYKSLKTGLELEFRNDLKPPFEVISLI